MDTQYAEKQGIVYPYRKQTGTYCRKWSSEDGMPMCMLVPTPAPCRWAWCYVSKACA